MMSNIHKLDISPDFIIDDIHRIREWNYERRKGMSVQERIDDINNSAREFEALIEAVRRSAPRDTLPLAESIRVGHTLS
jgi:hypothetical protein